MVDPDPGYRPKRAFVDPSSTDDQQDRPDGTESESESPSVSESAAADQIDQAPEVSTRAGDSVLEQPEVRSARPLNFRQRRRPDPSDEEATTPLPPTTAAGRASGAHDAKAQGVDDLDLDEEHPHRLLGRRGRLALLIGAVAAVAVVGAAIIFAVASVGRPAVQPTSAGTAGPGSASVSGAPATDAGALLADGHLLLPATAEQIDPARAWKVALTQRPAAADAPTPACLTDQPAEGEPAAQQQVAQLLSSDGKAAPSALHRAAAYATPEDAAQAYAVATRTFGGCVAAGSYLVSGATVTGLGDQAAGVVVNVVTGGKTQLHSVVVSRTGTVVNVVDVARPGKAVQLTGVARALAAVTALQCQAAGGKCDHTPVVKDAPPPLGGDVPGFLAAGDLPPAGAADESWVATPAEPPSETFLGSQCELVNWTRVNAASGSTRVYLVPSSTKFGLNDIVLTMKDEKAAAALVAKIKSDLQSCSKRKLTATVSGPAAVKGVGAQGAAVTGWTSTVSQKSTTGTQRYRVGIVSSGAKVAYTFLNPLPGGYDLSQPEWDMVAVRAGQRMTQVP
ncbi:MAG: hypothetical protein ACJ72K_01250 [Friedmanniella sp.]